MKISQYHLLTLQHSIIHMRTRFIVNFIRPIPFGRVSKCYARNAASNPERYDSNKPLLPTRLVALAPETKRIFLLRHGETDWNAAGRVQGGGYDLDLNANGQQQAQLLAQELADIPLDVIASSHLKRAQQTADIVHEHQHRDATRLILDGFGEMRFGEYEGVALRGPNSNEEITQRYKEHNERMKLDGTISWPGGESPVMVETRMIAALNQILEDYTDASYIGIVAHGRAINIMLASLLENDCRLFARFHQVNCCINVLDVSPERRYKSLVLNEKQHLERGMDSIRTETID